MVIIVSKSMKQLSDKERKILGFSLFTYCIKEGPSSLSEVENLVNKIGVMPQFEFFAKDCIAFLSKKKSYTSDLSLIALCYHKHVEDMDGAVSFTYDQYEEFWLNNSAGSSYKLKNRNNSVENCKIVYYPLPYYRDLRALVEVKNKNVTFTDYREVPVQFLSKI
jgi:hypothetical protein